MRCPIKKIDPGACVDFSTNGQVSTDQYKRGWELAFGRKDKKLEGKKLEREWRDGRFHPSGRSSADE
jgi:hypothetical protein